MKCPRISLSISMLSVLILGGCGSDSEPFTAAKKDDSSLANPDNVRIWANGTSALAIYLNAYRPIAIADGEDTFDDPACPATDDDGTTLDIEGSCTDTNDQQWLGKASVKRHANGDRELTLEDFGTQRGDQANTANGEASVRHIDDESHDFSLDMVLEGGVRTTIDYEGHVDGTYGTRTVWSGSGTVTREGLLPPAGTVDVTTSTQVIDSTLCNEPASGNTTLTDDAGNTVVVTYDGELDCDDKQAAPYSLNGVSKGKISGIACSTSAGQMDFPGASLIALALCAGCFAGRRGRRGRPGPRVQSGAAVARR